MFVIQMSIVGLLDLPVLVNAFVLGFVSAAGGILITHGIYLLTVKHLPHLGIRLVTTGQQLLLVKISVASFAILTGAYEGFAIPILNLWEFVPQHRVAAALVSGVLGGALSSVVIVAITRVTAINRRIWLGFSVAEA